LAANDERRDTPHLRRLVGRQRKRDGFRRRPVEPVVMNVLQYADDFPLLIGTNALADCALDRSPLRAREILRYEHVATAAIDVVPVEGAAREQPRLQRLEV